MIKYLDIARTLTRTFEKSELSKVVLFVTSACNLKCVYCFNRHNLNRRDDLRLEEIERISLGLPAFNHLLISGGEPFLRKELPDVIRLFYENNKIAAVTIPTNGTMSQAMAAAVKKILEISPRLKVSLFFSLDGLAEVHNSVRGEKETFEKGVVGIKALRRLRREYENLSININSVISVHNFDDIRKLVGFVRDQGTGFADTHCFDIVRSSPPDPSLMNMGRGQLESLFKDTILPYQEEQTRTSKKASYGFFAPIVSMIEMSIVALKYKMQLENLFQGKKWGVECQAGKSIIVIDSGGNLSSCESRPPLANARDIDYDVGSFLNSESFRNELQNIKKTGCSCIHSCFLTETIFKCPKLFFLTLPLLSVKGLIRPHGFRVSGKEDSKPAK